MLKICEVSGIKVLLNKLENDKSFSLSVCYLTGSRHEKENERGISHLLEHLMFTGTNTRNSFEINEEMDFYGAILNAYTNKEVTNYFFSSLSSKQEQTTDIFFDMLSDPIFSQDQIDKEKNIIFEEIKMYEDDIKSQVYETMCENMIEGSLSKNVIATKEEVESITRDMIVDYYKRRYTKDNAIISVSGNFDEDLLVKQIEKYFSKINDKAVDVILSKDILLNKDVKIRKDINQANIYLLKNINTENTSLKDEYIEFMIEVILGDGFSSRLFKEIREKRSLAYSVYGYYQRFDNFKNFIIYIGTSKNKCEEAVNVSKEIIKDLVENGIEEKELEKSKNYILSLRANSKDNYKLASRYLSMYRKYKKFYDENYIEKIVNEISLEDVNRKLKELSGNFSTCLIGDIDV